MRILLVGEYSRLHNSLKEGLIALGHEVILMGTHDGFKNYPVDIYINHSFTNKLGHKLKVGVFKLTGIDLGSLEITYKVKNKIKKLPAFDVVQLINEASFSIQPKAELNLLKFLQTKGKKLVVLSCSYDYSSVKFMLNHGFKYSAMTPYLKDQSLLKHYKFKLQYLEKDFVVLHDYIIAHTNGIIATDLDYHLPLVGKSNYLGLIPNPINTDKIDYIPMTIDGKIKIFHGINSYAALTKGNVFFSQALKIIAEKYGDRVAIITTIDMPYVDYIQQYNQCHIVLDMVYAYDQGYNALEAMAKGKVVFTGAEQEWLTYYKIAENTVAINALPNVHNIVDKLSELIEHPEKISAMSVAARAFVEREHHYKIIAQWYLDIWHSN
ncbi:glycosyltransferase family 1 protein [Gelidibacter salicanalis]|uniref:Glycosyltransferase family 1 protein n=1 Tax=Gelidibacter salicanalis TaxID=291193 RepID=A0A5C7AQ37_9FLAO|nr:glycosyltransferase [Gelidibacter salicanalis]TXE10517.1 glycosyltransferase family 1 protein [Gelidibacter salicanalis]